MHFRGAEPSRPGPWALHNFHYIRPAAAISHRTSSPQALCFAAGTAQAVSRTASYSVFDGHGQCFLCVLACAMIPIVPGDRKEHVMPGAVQLLVGAGRNTKPDFLGISNIALRTSDTWSTLFPHS